MQHRQLFRGITLVQEFQRGMQAEWPFERQRRALAALRQRDLTAQARVLGVAHRRHRGQTIERAAQQDEHET